MVKSNKNEKAEEVILHSFEEMQKLAMSFIPGGQILDSFINFRSNLKQKRVLNFSASLKETLEDILEKELTVEDFASEDLVDAIESVMNKVHATRSSYKLERFKNILVKKIAFKSTDQLLSKYIDLLDSINEIQLIILEIVATSDYHGGKALFYYYLANYQRHELGEHNMDFEPEKEIHIKLGEDDIITQASDVDFYLDQLVTIGLLSYNPTENEAALDSRGTELFQPRGFVQVGKVNPIYSLTPMGSKFVTFIREA